MGAVVYRITYPNGKVYVGMDLTGTALYFGSPRKAHIAADLGPEVCRDLTIRKQVLWESDTATEAEVRAKERELILAERANDPALGYNTWPRLAPNASAPQTSDAAAGEGEGETGERRPGERGEP